MSRNGWIDVTVWAMFLTGSLLLLLSVGYRSPEKAPEDCVYLGRLQIPTIDVDLPIYEGVSEDVLENGIGHITQSSPLFAGNKSHCLLAGHRGLMNRTLLFRLGELELGDQFFIGTYSYRVCDINVIHPEDTGYFQTEEERELVSLITCTPIGIHTHRLVVTGERIKSYENKTMFGGSAIPVLCSFSSGVRRGRCDTDSIAGGIGRVRSAL